MITIDLPSRIRPGCGAGPSPKLSWVLGRWVVHPATYNPSEITEEDLAHDTALRALRDYEVPEEAARAGRGWDKYHAAEAYLHAHPEEIYDAWANPQAHEAGCLFMWATRRLVCGEPEDDRVGCLTQIRQDSRLGFAYARVADSWELTAQIRDDDRIPIHEHEITLENLPVFAEWQRRLDRELRR